MSITIALVGNPNAGKSTLFNCLTGARQTVGNWAGVTVERKSGNLPLGNETAELIDLPGLYAMHKEAGYTPGIDEAISVDYLRTQQADLLINVVDASNLQRNLPLTRQLLNTGTPVVVALNMLDVASQQGINIDISRLEARLGVPVIPLVASKSQGITALLSGLNETLANARAGQAGQQPTSAQETLYYDASISEDFAWASEQVNASTTTVHNKPSLTEQLDRLALHRWLGIPVFLLMMYLLFFFAINLGAVFIDFFDILLGETLVTGLGQLLTHWQFSPWLVTLLADGIGGGIQLIGTFIPVIGFLYLCLSILEDSGYMARAAFVVDRLMAGIGLPGSAFVPLIVGFGCNVPSVMASRSLSREQDRLLTVAMAPFMSCGARLTVYALFSAAFFAELASLMVFLLYLLGIVVAVFTGWLFRRTIFPGSNAATFTEMPHYHLPVMRNIIATTWHRLSGFIKRAGSTIVLMVTLLTVINSIGTDGSFGNQDSKDSLLSYSSKALTPMLSPIGISEENWPATVGIFTGIFAKEAVVGSLDVLYQSALNPADDAVPEAAEAFSLTSTLSAALLSIRDNAYGLLGGLGDPLGLAAINDSADDQGVSNQSLTTMRQLFPSNYAAFCYLVLILLYTPCVAVIGAMKRESGRYWAGVVVAWSTFLGYWLASVMYQLSNVVTNPGFALPWLLASAIAMWLAMQGLKKIGNSPHRLPANIIARQS
ncbi:ferrous iron transport protein B [Aliamphritea hakodatensis]|uniref:ferrous iron transport protein B n=1 Tax=Aliamphritea hakodatensis TaxID=2895352 RepID=UPI0022FD8226|nr:ferrous iron transport protein B [Aliamphritea hakodatensis]